MARRLIFVVLMGVGAGMTLLWNLERDRVTSLARTASQTPRSHPVAGERRDEEVGSPPLFRSEAAPVTPDDSRRRESSRGSWPEPGGSVRRAGPTDRGVEPSIEIVRATLAEAIAARLPALDLSATELDELAWATLRMRQAQSRLRAIPKTQENANRRDQLLHSLEVAVSDFARLVDMTPAEFSDRVRADVGIDEWTADTGPLDVSIRPLPRRDGAE